MRSFIFPLAAAVTLLVAGCRNVGTAGTVLSEPKPVKVRTMEVTLSEVNSNKSYVGTVESSKSMIISSPVSAKVTELCVSEGEKVKAGDVLARLSSENVEATLTAAEATLRQAKDAYERINSVRASGSVAEVQIVEIETALAKAESMAAMARKAKEDCDIKASYDGTIGEIYFAVGEDVELMTPLFRLIDTEALEIVISVPETEIAAMRIGQKATVSVPAIDRSGISATLVRKGVVASALAHSYDCILRNDRDPEGLLPGMACSLRFVTGESEGEIVIPSSVVRTDENGRFVWTVNSSSRVEKTRIETGGFASKGVVVKSGLEAGDKVITDGASKVSSMMEVEIIP